MIKWLSTKLDRADQEGNALPVFHDLKLNIPLSDPPTKSQTIYL